MGNYQSEEHSDSDKACDSLVAVDEFVGLAVVVDEFADLADDRLRAEVACLLGEPGDLHFAVVVEVELPNQVYRRP